MTADIFTGLTAQSNEVEVGGEEAAQDLEVVVVLQLLHAIQKVAAAVVVVVLVLEEVV